MFFFIVLALSVCGHPALVELSVLLHYTVLPRGWISLLKKNRMTFKFAHDLPVGEFYAMV